MVHNKHFMCWILLVLMAFSLSAGIIGCQTPTVPPQSPSTPPPSTLAPTPAPAPIPTPTPAPTPSPSPLAKITQVTGNVEIKMASAAVWNKAAIGGSLKPGDSVRTSAGSTALIVFFEGSTIELNPNTEIRISELSVDDKTKATTIKLWQQVGKTKSRVEKLVDPASLYQVDTPTGAALVRGSIGEITVLLNRTTIILNIEGKWYALVNGVLIRILEGTPVWLLPDGSIISQGASIGGSSGGGGKR